jgi:hypothetical protein
MGEAVEWRELKPEDADGRFLWLRRDQRVTAGRYHDKQWCSLDGGFAKKSPPLQCADTAIPAGTTNWSAAVLLAKEPPHV